MPPIRPLDRLRGGALFVSALFLAAAGLPAQESPAAEALRELKNSQTPTGAEFERSRIKWPECAREIDEAIARQEESLKKGGLETDSAVKLYENRADVRGAPTDLYLLGRILGNVGRVEDAKVKFEAALRLDPYFPWAYHGIGTCHAKRDRFEEAVKAYKYALELNPDFIRSMEPLAGCLIQLGRAPEADALLRKIVERSPDHSAALLMLAKSQVATARFGEAVTTLKRLEVLKPGDEETIRLLGYSYRKSDRFDEAARLYQGILEKRPEDYHANRSMGELKVRLGENHAAADYFERAQKARAAVSPAEAEELRGVVESLRKAPAIEKRDPKLKTPEEWIEILLHSTEPERVAEAFKRLRAVPAEERYADIYSNVQKSFLNALKLNHVPDVKTLVLRELKASVLFEPVRLVPLVGLFVTDPDRRARGMALHFLGETRDPSAVPHVMKGLDDSDPYVFAQAHDALFKLTPAYFAPLLPEPLDKETMAELSKQWKDWYAENRDRYRKFEDKK